MSVTGAAGADKSPVTGRVAALSRDVFAGLVTSLMSVAYGLSFAALIFAPPLTPWIAYGIAATFVTTTISAAIVAVRSSFPFAIAGPDGATAAVTASLVAALSQRGDSSNPSAPAAFSAPEIPCPRRVHKTSRGSRVIFQPGPRLVMTTRSRDGFPST
jgi:MFS superfamily sulfate permease-like transporter